MTFPNSYNQVAITNFVSILTVVMTACAVTVRGRYVVQQTGNSFISVHFLEFNGMSSR